MTMQITVCIKQVPNTTKVKIDKKTGTLIRKGIKSIFNPDDKHALEEALRIKDQYQDVKITALTMGPPQAMSILEEALAMGADHGILLSDRKFAGSDTLATSTILAAALKQIQEKEGLDLVICGRQAIDGDTAQVGPQLAQHLDFPVISYVKQFEYDQKTNTCRIQRSIEEGVMTIETSLPLVITALTELNIPRYPHMKRIFEVYAEKSGISIEKWTLQDLNHIDIEHIGLNGSPTRVKKTFTPDRTFTGEILLGTIPEIAQNLVHSLKTKHII